MLQWGRGLSTAEMPGRNFRPRNGSWLQWGRGLSTAEMATHAECLHVFLALQWGRGLSTAEITFLGLHVTFEGDRFNGAAVFQPRKCLASYPDGLCRVAFALSSGPSRIATSITRNASLTLHLLSFGRFRFSSGPGDFPITAPLETHSKTTLSAQINDSNGAKPRPPHDRPALP